MAVPGGKGSEIFWQRVAVEADVRLGGATLVPKVAVVRTAPTGSAQWRYSTAIGARVSHGALQPRAIR